MNELGLSWDTANMPSLIELKAAKLWHKAPVHTKRFYESALSRGQLRCGNSVAMRRVLRAPCATCAVCSNKTCATCAVRRVLKAACWDG